MKVKTIDTIRDRVKNPTFSDLIHIKQWAYDYNLFVHPAVFKAMKIREKFIICGTVLIVALLILAISLSFNYLIGMI